MMMRAKFYRAHSQCIHLYNCIVSLSRDLNTGCMCAAQKPATKAG